MKRLPVLAALALAAALSACGGGDPDVPGSAGPSGAPTTRGSFSAVVSFGDSLSDVGTYTPATSLNQVTRGDPPYQGGRFTTNSPTAKVWVEDVAAGLATPLPITPHQFGFIANPVTCVAFLQGLAPRSSCTGHAQGGARVTDPNGIGKSGGALTVPVVTQIDNHLAFFESFKDTDLVFVWAGANDALVQFTAFGTAAGQIQAQAAGGAISADEAKRQIFAAQSAAQAEMKKAALELAGYIRTKILAKGGKYVAVMTVPDIAQTPLGRGLASDDARGVLTGLSEVFNLWLREGLAGAPVVLVDTFAVFRGAVANPASIGMENVTIPACNLTQIGSTFGVSSAFSLFCNVSGAPAINTLSPAPGANADTWLFADEIHPTTGGHRALANIVLTQLRAQGWIQ